MKTLAFACALLFAGAAHAETLLCLALKAPEKEQAGFEKLVREVVGHHPSHRLVNEGCASRLQLELFDLSGVRYLTARINQEVPVRFPVKDDDELADKLSTALSLVLGSDPVYLAEDISRYNAVQRAAHSVLKRGHNTFRLELFQGLGRSTDGVAFAPGGAVSLARGADHWQVYARVFFSGWPTQPTGPATLLRVNTGGDAGLAYEFSELGAVSFYLAAGFGLQYQRYDGLMTPGDPSSLEHRNDWGPTFHARAGLRLFRLTDFDLDLFATFYLPLYRPDVDTALSRFYPITAQAGIGVGF